MANEDQIPTPATQEGYLHSLAASLGIDPEAVKSTAKAIFANPKQAASEIGHEITDEVSDMVRKPLETAKTVGEGVLSQVTNPEAQATAHARISKPGLANKLAGAQEMVYSAIPLVGSGLTKAEEQATEGNASGSLGTMTGVAAPFVMDSEPATALKEHLAETGKTFVQGVKDSAAAAMDAKAPEGSSEAGFVKLGGKKVAPASKAKPVPTKAPAIKISTDTNGIKWAENPDGVRVSVPGTVSEDAVEDFAKTKIAEQAAMQSQLRASISPKLVETAGATQVTPPEPDAVSYHPDLQKIADKYGTSYSPRGASFIAPDGKFINLPDGVQHPNAITQVTGKSDRLVDNRPEFLNSTGAVRIRTTTQPYRGTLVNVSVPENMTSEQVQSIQQVVGKASQESGRNAHLTLERANVNTASKDSATTFKEHVSPRDVESMLKQIGAHPDQRAEAVKPSAAVAAPEAKPDVYELNADEGEETPTVAPNKTLQSSAQKYATAKGMEPIDHSPVEQDPARATRLARTYHDAADAPNDPKVAAAYDALKKETKDQFHHLRDDLGLKFEPQADDPYTSAGEMMNDVQKNNRLKVFTGSSTGESHPLSEIDPETGHSYNTLFRWVHDAMGHAAGGFDFSENGEKSATEAHAQMYSDKARPAMRAETEGQTSWFFHNPDVESGTKAVGDFAPQKATLLPDEWQPPKGLEKGIPSTAPVDTKIPLSKLSVSPEAYSSTSSDIAKGRGSKTQAPVRILYNPDNKQFLVEDGMHRVVEAHQKGEETVPAKLWSGYSDTVANVHGEKMDLSPTPWHERAGDLSSTEDAGGIDPRTGKTDTTGKGVEIMPELRQPIDHAPTAEDFQKFYEQHQEVFDKHPELRVGWDNNSAAEGGHEINVGAVGDEAARVAKKLDQKSAFDIEKGENIDTKGSGLRTEFPNYPLEDRMKDLRGENQSDVPQFEHLSRSVYDNLEPDERKYLEGNKTLQRNVMQKYHELQPSVEETTNAMQAGAALGGWWKRYIDIFHGLADEQVANTVGPSHAEVLKQVHAALSANKPVNQANNLAWSFYADWLDEGKPTDRKSIDTILKRYGAEKGEREGQTGNASITDTYKRGKVVDEGLDTSKIYHLVNSPEMRGERPFHNDVFSDDANKNPLMGPTKGARKIPSMGATVAGKGNLNRLVIDTHIRDFYGQKQQGSAPQYIADSAHLRQAAKALGLQGGEGQEQLWGTVLGLKYLLKEGLTPPEAAGTLSARVIHQIGKDYAEVISNDPDITKQGGILDRLKEKHGIGGGSAGFGETYSKTRSASAGASKSAGSQAPVSTPVLGKTATRIRQSIPDAGIKKLADSRELFPNEGDTSFNFGANAQ